MAEADIRGCSQKRRRQRAQPCLHLALTSSLQSGRNTFLLLVRPSPPSVGLGYRSPSKRSPMRLAVGRLGLGSEPWLHLFPRESLPLLEPQFP